MAVLPAVDERADAVGIAKEGVPEILGGGARGGAGNRGAEGGEHREPEESEGVKEYAEDGRTVLAAGKAEVGEEGDGPAGQVTEEAEDRDAQGDILPGEVGPPFIGALPAEAVVVGAEGAPAGLFGEQAVGIAHVGVDSPGDSAYSLQRSIPSGKGAAGSLVAKAAAPETGPPAANTAGGLLLTGDRRNL